VKGSSEKGQPRKSPISTKKGEGKVLGQGGGVGWGGNTKEGEEGIKPHPKKNIAVVHPKGREGQLGYREPGKTKNESKWGVGGGGGGGWGGGGGGGGVKGSKIHLDEVKKVLGRLWGAASKTKRQRGEPSHH